MKNHTTAANVDQYLQQIGSLSEAKAAILKRLWQACAQGFPGGWVSSAELLKLTGQKYFDRRIRELCDENGCDIETGYSNGGASYRLVSATVTAGNKRGYLTAAEKLLLFKSQNYTCQVCDRKMLSTVQGNLHLLQEWQREVQQLLSVVR